MTFLRKFTIPLSILSVVFISCSHPSGEKMTPRDLAKRVSDILVAGTKFHFEPALQESEQDGVCLVNFPSKEKGAFYARSVVQVAKTGERNFKTFFAISHPAGVIKIWLDGNPVYSNSTDHDGHFNDVDYGLFEFQKKVPVVLPAGKHQLAIRFSPKKPGHNRIWISFVRSDNGLPDPAVHLHAPSTKEDLPDTGYWWTGPFPDDTKDSLLMNPNLTPTDLMGQQFATSGGGILQWDLPVRHLVRNLPGRLTYENWHYSTGIFLDAMEKMDDHFKGLDYSGYISKELNFFLNNKDMIARAREKYGLIESPFEVFYRFSLLDDMGTQTIPYVDMLIKNKEGKGAKNPDVYKLVKRATDHIMNDVTRLPDGTFARLTPDTMSVWADDLYMGSVVLLRMYELTHDEDYLNEAVKQTIRFDDHLRDPASNLYWHGWFSRSRQHSPVKWGRANGWTMMANVELLLAMPRNHPQREKILEIFRRHAAGLLAVQSEGGRWHQVLDDPSTYLETSATAMFVRAYAVGIVKGWLDRGKYAGALEKGWAALTRQVNDKGDITGIAPGTDIMFSSQAYQNRGPRLNDPRGFGAIIYAAIAMDKYQNLD